jgi:hypothetical protein
MANPWMILGASLLLAAAGSAAGYKVRDFQATERRAACAASINDLTLKNCPQEIVTAFDAVKGQLAITQIEYRDRTVTVMAQGSTEDRAARRALSDQIAALSNVEKTYACAASPAFELRRSQLWADAAAEGVYPGPSGADEAP